MKRVISILSIVVVAGVAGFIHGRMDWQQFESGEGRFAATFPGKPDVQVQSVPTAAGPISTKFFIVDKGKYCFSINYADYSQEIMDACDPELMLEGAQEGATQAVRGVLLESKEISLDGHPGREAKVELPAKDGIVRVRFYLVNNRMYVVQALTFKSNASAPELTKFLDSFQLR